MFEENKFSSVDSLRSKLADLFWKYTNGAEGYLGMALKENSFHCQVMRISPQCMKNIKEEVNLWMKIKSRQQKRLNESSVTPSTKRAKA